MIVQFESGFLEALLYAEAEARDCSLRLKQLTSAREQDGLDETDALTDAAESLGLLPELRESLASALAPLADGEVATVELQSAHGGMPTLRRIDQSASLSAEPARLSDLRAIVEALVARWLQDVDRTAVTLPVGLGGSGGCACGDDLPEDQPPGPLFER